MRTATTVICAGPDFSKCLYAGLQPAFDRDQSAVGRAADLAGVVRRR
jgi:hypothetical protein